MWTEEENGFFGTTDGALINYEVFIGSLPQSKRKPFCFTHGLIIIPIPNILSFLFFKPAALLNFLSCVHTQTHTNSKQEQLIYIDHFTRCKQHWSRNTSCLSL